MRILYYLIVFGTLSIFTYCKTVYKEIPAPPLVGDRSPLDSCDSTNYIYHPEHAYQIKIINNDSLYKIIYNNLKIKEKKDIDSSYKNQIMLLLKINTHNLSFMKVEILKDKSIELSQETSEKIIDIVTRKMILEISCSAKLYYMKFKDNVAVFRWDFQKNFLKSSN